MTTTKTSSFATFGRGARLATLALAVALAACGKTGDSTPAAQSAATGPQTGGTLVYLEQQAHLSLIHI